MLKTKSLLLVSLSVVIGFTSCKEEGCTDPEAINYNSEAKKDDGSCEYDDSVEVPSTYSFENMTYGGQTARLLLLKDLVDEIKSGSATKSSLNAIYQNTAGDYADIASDKDLQGKIANQADEDSLQAWFQDIEDLGGGYVRSDSVDLKQMVEKTLMGSVLYYRAVNDYLDGMDDDDNSEVTDGKGTEMEHHFDEAFGYFGAARDYNNYTDSEIKSDGEKDSDGDGTIDPESEKCFYYAQTAAKRDLGSADMGSSSQTDYTTALFDAFLKARTAISNADYEERDAQVDIIKDNWDEIIAATVVHYINETKDDINNSGSDLNKHWAEMRAYLNMIPYNPDNALGDTNFDTVDGYVGNKPSDTDVSKLDNAASVLKDAYGFTSDQISEW